MRKHSSCQSSQQRMTVKERKAGRTRLRWQHECCKLRTGCRMRMRINALSVQCRFRVICACACKSRRENACVMHGRRETNCGKLISYSCTILHVAELAEATRAFQLSVISGTRMSVALCQVTLGNNNCTCVHSSFFL